MPVESSNRLPLHAFQEALARYLEEFKPDPLALKQLKSWQLVWNERVGAHHSPSSSSENNDNHALEGSLEIHSDYMVVTMDSSCTWTSPNSGNLDFFMRAQARFIRAAADKTDRKIRAAMIKRLRSDDYIKPLLESATGVELCEAHIQLQSDSGELQERVFLDETAAEGIRRCIYSHSNDGTLSLFELFMSLPFLPSNRLAKRAKLRILEDAMVEACDQQRENDLLDALSLETPASKRTKQHD